MATGRTSKEIAGQLGISESTVNWHISNVFGRLGASSRAEAVALAMRDDLDDHQGAGEQVEQGASEPVKLPARRTARPPLPLSTVALAVAVTLVIGLLGGAVLAGWDFTSLTSPPPSAAPASHPVQQTAAPAGVPSSPAPTADAPSPAPAATARPTSAPVPGSPAAPSALPLVAPALGTVAPVLPAVSPTSVPVPVGSAPALLTLPPLPSPSVGLP